MTKNGEPVLVMGGAKQTVNQFCERALAEVFFRNGADRRFEPGAARIAITDCKWNPLAENTIGQDTTKLLRLKLMLELISRNYNNREKINNDLNGESYDSLYETLSSELKKEQEEENKQLSNLSNQKREHTYKIIRIDSFEESCKYHDLTNPKSRWCLTYSKGNYNVYTQYGKYALYFCLRDDIETVPYKIGEGCPLDEYGKSMLCVIVDLEGNLSTFTTRWNHVNADGKQVPADQNVGDKLKVSEIVGVNFNEVFKPYTPEELEQRGINIDVFTYENLTEDDSDVVNSIQTSFIALCDELRTEYEESYDEDEDNRFDPDDATWEDILEHVDWDFDRIFADNEFAAGIDVEKSNAYDDIVYIHTVTGVGKLINPMHTDRDITGWCDSIIPLYVFKIAYSRHMIFAMKEHGMDFYKFIDVNLSNGQVTPDIETNFDNKFKYILDTERIGTGRDNPVILGAISNNKAAQFLVSVKSNKIYITQQNEITLPEKYMKPGTVRRIFGHNKNALYEIKNNDTGLINLISAEDGFKLKLKPEDEYSHSTLSLYNLKYNERDDNSKFSDFNAPLYVYYRKDDGSQTTTLLDPKTFELIFDKNSDIEHSYFNPRAFIKIINETPIKNKLNKYDLEIYYYTKNGECKVVKLNDIYTNRRMMQEFFKENEYNISSKPVIAFVFENPECNKIIIFDPDNNILYRSSAPEDLNELSDDELNSSLCVRWDRYAYTNPDIELVRYSTVYLRISEKNLNLKKESFILKYAAYLLG